MYCINIYLNIHLTQSYTQIKSTLTKKRSLVPEALEVKSMNLRHLAALSNSVVIKNDLPVELFPRKLAASIRDSITARFGQIGAKFRDTALGRSKKDNKEWKH